MRKQKDIEGCVRGWTAVLHDGTVMSEASNTWGDAKGSVKSLSLMAGVKITLPSGMKTYVQGKTASCSVSGGSAIVESRWIGFDSPSGDRIIVRMSEADGNISIEVVNNDSSGNDKKI